MSWRLLILLLASVLLAACGGSDGSDGKNGEPGPKGDPAEAPELKEVKAVPTPGMDTTPSYTFSSSMAGSIMYSGGCSASLVNAVEGDNTITFHQLEAGKTYESCVLALITSDGGVATLPITPFKIQANTINDTGITQCGNYAWDGQVNDLNNHANDLDCDAVAASATKDGEDNNGNVVPAGQDAHFGRDALAAKGELYKVGSGPAGFDYTPLDENGDELNARSCVLNPSGGLNCTWKSPDNTRCLRDNVTNLVWEVKTNDDNDLQYVDHIYTWYNTDSSNNGGNPGEEGSNLTCSVLSKCNTQAYVKKINNQGLCGFGDWRMPTSEELLSLVNKAKTNPAANEDYLGPVASSYYWSASPDANVDIFASSIGFGYGDSNDDSKLTKLHVRLVRGGH